MENLLFLGVPILKHFRVLRVLPEVKMKMAVAASENAPIHHYQAPRL